MKIFLSLVQLACIGINVPGAIQGHYVSMVGVVVCSLIAGFSIGFNAES